MQKKYLSFSHPLPGPVGLLFKKAAEKNAEVMRGLTIEEHRDALERLADVRMISPRMRYRPVYYAGVSCEWIYHMHDPGDHVILYIHGGSWAFGTLHTARPVGMQLNQLTGCRVLVVDYRLSPEFPFPAGLDDCSAVYADLCAHGFSADRITIFGDSAGGNLALALVHRLRQEGKAVPAALGLASPVTDLTQRSMLSQKLPDLLFTQYEGREQDIFSLYCGEQDRSNPLISPVYGDLTGFPPMLIHVGQDEELCIDCAIFAQKAEQSGVEIALKIWRQMYHDFTIVGTTLKESRKSLGEFADFFRRYL